MLGGGIAPPLKLASARRRATLVVKLVTIELPCKPKLGAT
jgi:hypothetical protein